MRRFDLYHCPGDQLCARILWLTQTAGRGKRAHGARRLDKPKGTHPVPKASEPSDSKHTLQLGISWSLLMTKRCPRESCLNLFQPRSSCCDSRTALHPLLIQAEELPSSRQSADNFPKLPGVPFFFNDTILVVFSMFWQLKSLSIKYLTTPSDLKMKQIESKWVFYHEKLCMKSMNTHIVFQTYFFLNIFRDFRSMKWHWTFFTGMLLVIESVWNKNVLSQAQKAAWNFRDCPAQLLWGAGLFKTLGWQSQCASFSVINRRLHSFRKFQNNFFRLSGCCQRCDVSVLIPYTGHQTCPEQHHSLWHMAPTWEMVPVKLELHSQDSQGWTSAALWTQKEVFLQGGELAEMHSWPRGWFSFTPSVLSSAKHVAQTVV